MSLPLVSVICLCYNHEKYVAATLASVWAQSYAHLEVVIVDDASQDQSVASIRKFLADNPADFPVKTIFLEENLGNCTAFNRGWKLTKGKYVIDLATDDVMSSDRIAKQVTYFERLPDDYGVLFTESQYIDEQGIPLYFHFKNQYRHIRPIPTGDVYQDVLSKYFISSPTMMVKGEVLQALNGYDESLAYEDFDLWVRSARQYKYAYLDECTTWVRKLSSSMSSQLYEKNDRQLESTFLVCQKAEKLNKTHEEQQALGRRIRYEARHALLAGKFEETRKFLSLLKHLGLRYHDTLLLEILLLLRVNLSVPYRWFLTLRSVSKR